MVAGPRTRRSRPSAHELAAATPPTRNRYVDLLRFVSIAVVVLGHWLIAVLGFRDGAFVGENPLEIFPDAQIATWLFQVMAIFFMAGGHTNALSWESATRRRESYGDWLRARYHEAPATGAGVRRVLDGASDDRGGDRAAVEHGSRRRA